MRSKQHLFRYYVDTEGSGTIEGLFVATRKEVREAIGRYAYFGDILGKHSDVGGTIEEIEITEVDMPEDLIREVAARLGRTWSGYNPLHYITD